MDKAVILAAGKGTKIWPYGETRPKCAIPVANRPLIQHTIETLKQAGCKDIAVVAGHHQNQVKNAVAGLPKVRIVVQTDITGTAQALLTALRDQTAGDVLVVYGDLLVQREDIARFLKTYETEGTGFAALVNPLGNERSNDWLCCRVEDGRIKQVLSHPRTGVSHRLCGIYAFSADMIPYLERNPGVSRSVQVGVMPVFESEIAESLQSAIDDGNDTLAVETEGMFVDLDKPWHILEANSMFLNQLSENMKRDSIAETAQVAGSVERDGFLAIGENSVIGAGVKIKGNLWVGTNSRIEDGAIIGSNVCIGNDCSVSKYCDVGARTCIGDRSRIGHCAEISGVIMDGVHAVHYGEYWGVIGSATDLGAATVCGNLRFDDRDTIHSVKGRRETPLTGANAAYVGDFCRTGVNVMIMPGAKIGPYSVIGPGTIVTEDVPGNSLVYVRQELVKRHWGPEKYGW